MNQAAIWVWVPKKSIGPFVFGRPLLLSPDYGFEMTKLAPDIEAATWDTFEIEGEGVRVYVEDNEITFVECWKALYFNWHNLIDVSTKVVLSALRGEFLVKDEDVSRRTRELVCADLGIVLWEENGCVKACTVSN